MALGVATIWLFGDISGDDDDVFFRVADVSAMPCLRPRRVMLDFLLFTGPVSPMQWYSLVLKPSRSRCRV